MVHGGAIGDPARRAPSHGGMLCAVGGRRTAVRMTVWRVGRAALEL